MQHVVGKDIVTAVVRTPPRPTLGVVRAMHPWAWWVWALGLAGCVSMSTNPWLVVPITLAAVVVVLRRRTQAPWARAVGAYFMLALAVIAIRLLFQVLLGGDRGATVLFRLPELRLPEWAVGIHVGGPVTAEGLVTSLLESMRLAAMLVCVGAANALANPRRALRCVPAALYELSVAVTISLTLAPQLVESVQRVRRARRLRGGRSTGWRAVRGVVVPVLSDAVDRSMALARGMESRGFGRTRSGTVSRSTTALLAIGGLLATAGVFALLGMSESMLPGQILGLRRVDVLTAGLLLLGTACTGWGLRSGGRQLAVTHYRPDPWQWPEYVTVGCGLGAAACSIALSAGAPVVLTVTALSVPSPHPLMGLAFLLALAPAVATPPAPRTSSGRIR